MFILGPLGGTIDTARIGLVTLQFPLSRETPAELGRFPSRVSCLPGPLPTSQVQNWLSVSGDVMSVFDYAG